MNAVTLDRATSGGYARDLEACDCDSQLTWYAEDSEVSIVSKGQRSPRCLRGRSAIGDWIERTCSETRAIRVVYHGRQNDEITVIAEFQDHDGTFGIYSCIAQLHHGLIVNQRIVLL